MKAKQIKNIKKHLNYIFKNISNFEELLNGIRVVSIKKSVILSLIIVLVGIFLNYNSQNRFPYFFPFQLLLLVNLYVAFYSIRKVEILNIQLQTNMSGDKNLLVESLQYKRRRTANINYLYAFVVSTLATPFVFIISDLELDRQIKIYCFLALYVILFVSVIGYMQYIYFVEFVWKLSKIDGRIENYNVTLPHKTKWLLQISDLSHLYNNMFFLVGLIYIVLFYAYTITDIYDVNLTNSLGLIFVVSAWGILAIDVVCMLPFTTIYSYCSIKKTVKKLKTQRLDNLTREQVLIKDNRLKITYDSLIILLQTTPDYPAKHLASYIFAYGIAVINFVASLQACHSLAIIIL